MSIISFLCRDGKYDEAAEKISELIHLYDRHEPKSHSLYFEAGRLFSRVVSLAKIIYQFSAIDLEVTDIRFHEILYLLTIELYIPK